MSFSKSEIALAEAVQINSKLNSKPYDYLYKFTVVSLHKKKKCQVTRRKELFYYVTSGSNVMRDVH